MNLTPASDTATATAGLGWLERGTVPALDGLRACSILIVLLAHAAEFVQGSMSLAERNSSHLWIVAEAGHLGVDMFFVISGFIITLLLSRERRRSGTVSLSMFYLRRALRIVPAYGALLLFLFVVQRAGVIALDGRDWLGALTYTISFMPQVSRPVGHIWSLSVEEHFYFLWPPLVRLLRERAWLVPLFCMLAMPFARLLIASRFSASLSWQHCTLTRLDGIACGALLASTVDASCWRRLTSLPTWLPTLLIPLLAVAIGASELLALHSDPFRLLLHPTLVALGYGSILMLAAHAPRALIVRALDSRILVWGGLLSYSLYLWQQFFLDATIPGLGPLAVRLLLVFAAAIGSRYIVERPFLALKGRLSV